MLDKTYNFSFSTELVRPKVEVIDPPDGTLTVNYNLKTISIEFNKEIDFTTINNYTVALTNVDNYSVRYQDKTAYIENFRLMEKTDYTVFVSSQIRDTSGFTLEKSYQSRFRTTYDTPYIKTVFPSNNATNVPPSLPNIDIEFSEDMNFENLNESLFIIEPAVPFSLKVTDSKSVQLKILSPLLSGNTYTVRVKDAITDISGIRMDKPFESSFKVAATPDNNLPSDIVIYSKYISEPVTDRRKGFILEWKAPSADIINSKPTGKIRGYSLVYSEEPFDYKDFNKMTEIAGVPTPANPGDIQNMILYSLIDKENNEKPLVYNKTYYFMLRATDGTNFVYSNLLATGIIAEKNKIFLGDKFSGVSMKYIRNFNKENVFAIGNTGDSENGKTLGSVSIMKIVNGNINELFRIYGKSENSLFGYKIESADINNDGCPDLIVSAPLNGQEREGAIFIYTQTKNGSDCIFTPSEPVRISGGTKESMFGFSLNKFLMNGKENLIVGAPNSKGLNTGEVFIYFNRTNILQIPQRGDVVITGKNSGSSFGYASVASDFNGDSCPDLIISAPDELSGKRGSVFILYTATSVNGCVIQNTDIENANLRIDGVADYTRLGYNLFTADINGDNINELILSGRDEAANSGVIFIREPNKTNILKITGEYGGNFGVHIEAANDCRMNGCDGGINAKCK
ncbi:MAG: Ig-like domain-containing protein, partial [Deltaproteobacteria bacterium]|nr:Ig-like domain-containing protein [Deltaproteobacteria bacterium]